MVMSDSLFSPQTYVELVTGNCYIFDDGTVKEIEHLLHQNGLDFLWNYPLEEIDHIVKNQLNVVLVECVSEEAPYITELRWFEVPKAGRV